MALAATNTMPTFDVWEDPLALLPRRKPQQFERDQTIYSREDPAESLYLVVDGAVNLIGRSSEESSFVFRRVQTGLVQNYALLMLAGVFAFVSIYLLVR